MTRMEVLIVSYIIGVIGVFLTFYSSITKRVKTQILGIALVIAAGILQNVLRIMFIKGL